MVPLGCDMCYIYAYVVDLLDELIWYIYNIYFMSTVYIMHGSMLPCVQ